ncbi:MAG: protein kinase [Acidobacteriota bacterium]
MTSLPRAIGPYRILRALGRGGMGVVYRAEHASTGEEVALKTVRLTPDGTRAARGSSRASAARSACARIRHPGVARILAEGIESGIPWYAMELCAGVTLDRYAPKFVARQTANFERGAVGGIGAPRRADDLDASAWWTGALTEGLDTPELPALPDADDARPGEPEARRDRHRRARRRPPVAPSRRSSGWCAVSLRAALLPPRRGHRPPRSQAVRNVLVREGGMPVIVDFGLAASSHPHVSRDALDVGAAAAGTAAYMSPEQARGDLVDARADLYALGCILYSS